MKRMRTIFVMHARRIIAARINGKKIRRHGDSNEFAPSFD